MSDQKNFLEGYVVNVVKVLQDGVGFSIQEPIVEKLKAELRSQNFKEFKFSDAFRAYTLSAVRPDGKNGLFLIDETNSKSNMEQVSKVNDTLLILHENMVKKLLGK